MNDVHFIGEKNNLKMLFGIINCINEETSFKFKEDEIIINSYDKSKTVYLNMRINKDYFQTFKVKKPKEIGFNVSKMLKIIEMCTNKISILINEEIISISKKEIDIEAHLPQIYIEDNEIIIPQHEYTTSALIKIKYFKENLPNLLEFSSFIEIDTEKKIKLKSSFWGNHVIIDLPVEPRSKLDQKDRSIIVDISVMNKIFSYLKNNNKIVQLGIDKSFSAIEFYYQEENLDIKVLFSRLNR